ncbi:hypothetical protein K438DRAFT_583024 [Mycena galopus ATCC 62051]|nr:hypothetical protein K438DRAFT_583024 [Mycena galopus ATCC 62051]
MPCAWDQYFDLNQVTVRGFQDGLSVSVALAVGFQTQKWSHCLLATLRGLLVDHDYSAVHFRNDILPTIQRLLRLLLQQDGLITSLLRYIVYHSSPNPCSVHFAELKTMYAEIGDATPTGPQLEKTQHIVAALHDSHDWAYNSLSFIANFLNSRLVTVGSNNDDADADPLFEPMAICNTILLDIASDPAKQLVTEFPLMFPPKIKNIAFIWLNPSQLDVLVRIVFHTFDFFASSDLHTYLVGRRNANTINYTLAQCNLVALARKLAGELSQRPVSDLARQTQAIVMDPTILQIVIVANCVKLDSVAIKFIDEVLGHAPPDIVHQCSAILAVHNLRRLRHINTELIGLSDPTVVFPRLQLQEILHDEPFQTLSPLFLPKEVDIQTVIDSSRIHLLNQYILMLLDVFEELIPAAAKTTNSPFFVPNVDLWPEVDSETQHRFFSTILAHIESLGAIKEPNSRSDSAAVATQLWASDLFWIDSYWGGRKANGPRGRAAMPRPPSGIPQTVSQGCSSAAR